MFEKIDPREMDGNVFRRIGDQWMLVTAGDRNGCNTMTASWGGLGVLWGEPVATAYVRPQRYTKEFIDREKYFSLSFYDEKFRKQLALCGAKSGRDIDKVKECNFTVEYGLGDTPYFAEAELVLICEKQYADELKPEKFIDTAAAEKWYPQKDWHTMYIGKIVEVLKKN
ncbi:MAG: flavin reductase family protein [Oscillospiraceae bacterium]